MVIVVHLLNDGEAVCVFREFADLPTARSHVIDVLSALLGVGIVSKRVHLIVDQVGLECFLLVRVTLDEVGAFLLV